MDVNEICEIFGPGAPIGALAYVARGELGRVSRLATSDGAEQRIRGARMVGASERADLNRSGTRREARRPKERREGETVLSAYPLISRSSSRRTASSPGAAAICAPSLPPGIGYCTALAPALAWLLFAQGDQETA